MTGQQQRLISRGELSTRVSCSKTLVYKLAKKGARLHHTLVDGKYNLNHPDVVAFCAQYNYQEPDTALIAAAARKRGMEIAKKNHQRPAPQPKASPIDPQVSTPPWKAIADFAPIGEAGEEADLNANAYLEMTLYEIATRYGTQAEFAKLVGAAKSLVQMRGYEEEQARKRGEYIHRSHAERIIAMVDGMQKALLTDAVSNMANTVSVMVRSGAEKPEIERAMREVVSRIIKSSKEQLTRALRDL